MEPKTKRRPSKMPKYEGENRRERSFWNGTATKILSAFVVLLAFLGGYLFTEVVSIPKVYAEKSFVVSLENKMSEEFKVVREGISEINRFLRDSNK